MADRSLHHHPLQITLALKLRQDVGRRESSFSSNATAAAFPYSGQFLVLKKAGVHSLPGGLSAAAGAGRPHYSRDGGALSYESSIEEELRKNGDRNTMAAGFFMALSLLLQQEEAAVAFPWEKKQVVEQVVPSKGTCATCIGVVDETLGSCNSTANCVSSFDDRPKFFVAPWEFPGQLPAALERLKSELLSSGGRIEEQEERYVHAVFTSKDGVVDDVEFLFSDPREDATVVLRAASRAVNVDDKQRNRERLEKIRKSLTWDNVPVLRNRKRALFFLESPWDSFGPEPPPSFDYKNDGLAD